MIKTSDCLHRDYTMQQLENKRPAWLAAEIIKLSKEYHSLRRKVARKENVNVLRTTRYKW